jgi:hypothetical protein
MSSRSDDRNTPWRQLIFGVAAIGGFLPIGLAVLGLADTYGEFTFVRACFVSTGLCFIICYVLWWIGRHRSRKRKIAWGAATLVGVTAVLGLGLPWVSQKENAKASPDVSLCFVTYKHPVLIVLNISDKSVENARFGAAIVNLGGPNPDEPIHAGGRTFELIEAHGTSGPYDVFTEINDSPPLKDGDRVVGTVSIGCPRCKTARSFSVSFTWGRSDGWFSQIKDQTSGGLYTPMEISDLKSPHVSARGVATFVDAIAAQDRVPIRSLQDLRKGHSVDFRDCANR